METSQTKESGKKKQHNPLIKTQKLCTNKYHLGLALVKNKIKTINSYEFGKCGRIPEIALH